MGETKYSLYSDIQNRTNGEIYLGVVGPVRTGKSTFIKQFMEQMVHPALLESAELDGAGEFIKCFKIVSPTSPLFSGWNWVA